MFTKFLLRLEYKKVSTRNEIHRKLCNFTHTKRRTLIFLFKGGQIKPRIEINIFSVKYGIKANEAKQLIYEFINLLNMKAHK